MYSYWSFPVTQLFSSGGNNLHPAWSCWCCWGQRDATEDERWESLEIEIRGESHWKSEMRAKWYFLDFFCASAQIGESFCPEDCSLARAVRNKHADINKTQSPNLATTPGLCAIIVWTHIICVLNYFVDKIMAWVGFQSSNIIPKRFTFKIKGCVLLTEYLMASFGQYWGFSPKGNSHYDVDIIGRPSTG